MYRNVEIVTQQEPPAVFSFETHYDECLMRIYMRVDGKLAVQSNRRARELLKDRFRVIILYLDTDATVRGGSAKSRKCTVAECLHGARARGSRDVFRLRVSIAMFRKRSIADEEKKEEVLLRVLLVRRTVAESLQSICPDVDRRGHRWRCHP